MFEEEVNIMAQQADIYISEDSCKVKFPHSNPPSTEKEALEKINKIKKYQEEQGRESGDLIVETADGKMYSLLRGYI